MAIWPASLPQSMEMDVSDKMQTAFLRTEMDAGPYKQRTRFTAASRYISGTMVLSQAQRQTFDVFYAATLGYGADSFTWYDPVDGAAVDMRLIDTPDFQAIRHGGTGVIGKAFGHWRVSLSLEILPTIAATIPVPVASINVAALIPTVTVV